MTLSVGGIATLIGMPIVGALITKVEPRFLLALGFLVYGLALWKFAGITLDVDAGYLTEIRFFSPFASDSIFIPVQTLAYSGVPM